VRRRPQIKLFIRISLTYLFKGIVRPKVEDVKEREMRASAASRSDENIFGLRGVDETSSRENPVMPGMHLIPPSGRTGLMALLSELAR
jgi:hypothetical protein